ncbi:unnamed protein product [Clonostachys rosea f. rosea IK726]|uniref:Uncharacterized protein n=1 Tax=Clonostachys rosea f. rosea IK726 TaxID=1349383 RepID=A0ACA9UEV3_BIOOC|nr:unnamed protein product [Clonostachys rosea f. rosea IK726]
MDQPAEDGPAAAAEGMSPPAGLADPWPPADADADAGIFAGFSVDEASDTLDAYIIGLGWCDHSHVEHTPAYDVGIQCIRCLVHGEAGKDARICICISRRPGIRETGRRRHTFGGQRAGPSSAG